MDTEITPSPADLYRHRSTFERIKKGALYASNAISSTFSVLQSPAEFQAIQAQLEAALKILREARQSLKTSQIEFQTSLSPLSTEWLNALKVLDESLVLYEQGAHQWLVSNRSFPLGETVLEGDWVYVNQSIWMSFEFRADLDSAAAEVTQLCLGWRFPGVECRLADEGHIGTCIWPPLFKFGQWAEDHDLVSRPETTGLRSEFLKAFLPHVPELAFLASYVASCTLTLDRGREWQASLPAFNTNAKPASRQ